MPIKDKLRKIFAPTKEDLDEKAAFKDRKLELERKKTKIAQEKAKRSNLQKSVRGDSDFKPKNDLFSPKKDKMKQSKKKNSIFDDVF